MRIMYTLIIIGACCMPVWGLGSDKLSPSELLDRYTANQDKLRSLTAKTEETITSDWSNEQSPEIMRWVSEIRIDDKRTHRSWYRWLNPPTEDAPIPIENAQSYLRLWDGNRYIESHKSVETGSRVSYISHNEQNFKDDIISGYYSSPFLGIRYSSYERIDSVLRQADTISVRNELDQVGSVDCYVIDAKTKSGTYTVWIDPEHDYSIVKADIRMESNEWYCGRRLRDNESRSLSVRNVSFENVDGVYIPMETDLYSITTKQNGVTVRNVTHQKITQITLDPNHDVLGSFIPDIENGTKVRILEVPGINYTWQDGKLVSQIDEYVIEEIDRIAEGMASPKPVTDTKTGGAPNNLTGSASTQPKAHIDTVKTRPGVVAESGSSTIELVILLGVLIIGVIGWLVFTRVRSKEGPEC